MRYAILLLVLLSACTPNEVPLTPPTTLIEGRFNNVTEPGYYYLIKSRDAQDFKNFYTAIDSCWVDSSGLFELKAHLTTADFFQIRMPIGFSSFYDKDFYLQPNDTLHVLQTEKKVEFTGHSAALNQFQWDITALIYDDPDIKKAYNEKRYLKPDRFVTYINTLKKEQQVFLAEWLKKHPVSDEYKGYLSAKIQAQWTNDYWDYMKYHNYYAHNDWTYLSMDSLGYDFLQEATLDSTFHFIQNYGQSINGFVTYLHEVQTKEFSDSLKWATVFKDKFTLIKDNLHGINRDIALLMLSKEFWQYLTNLQDDFYPQAKTVNDFFQNTHQSSQYYQLFADNYKGFVAIAPQQQAPDFTLVDSSGNPVSLSDFIGKVVYIDFWGTWCGPCIAAIPKHLELQEKLKEHQENIVYLNIALEYDDKNIEEWKKFIKKKNWPGVHVVAKKQFHNKALKAYQLNSAPSYILIDQEGKIVSPRANSPKDVFEDILKLLS